MPADKITELLDLVPATIGIVDGGAIQRKWLVVKRALPFADLPIIDEPKPDETEADLLDGLLGPDGDDWDAVASAYLWFDEEAAKERGEKAREDYKLPIGRRDSDGVVRVYFEKVSQALGAINGGRGGVDIPAADKQRAFDVGLQYYGKLNGQLSDDEQKELPEFTGITRREHMPTDIKKQEENGEDTGAQDSDFPILTGAAKEQLVMVAREFAKLENFENMEKADVQAAIGGIHDALWNTSSNLVALAKRAGVTVTKTADGISFGQPATESENATMPTETVIKAADALALAIPAIEEYAAGLEDEEMKAAVAQAIAMLKAAPAEKAEHEDEDDAAVAKRWLEKADRSVREAFKALEKRTATAEGIALEERDLRLEREAVAKAETDFALLGDAVTVGAVLKSAQAALDVETYDKLLGVLKGANDRAGENDALLREIGKRNPVNADSAEGRVRALAKTRVDNGTSKTVAQAIAAVLKADPVLHAEYKAEK